MMLTDLLALTLIPHLKALIMVHTLTPQSSRTTYNLDGYSIVASVMGTTYASMGMLSYQPPLIPDISLFIIKSLMS